MSLRRPVLAGLAAAAGVACLVALPRLAFHHAAGTAMPAAVDPVALPNAAPLAWPALALLAAGLAAPLRLAERDLAGWALAALAGQVLLVPWWFAVPMRSEPLADGAGVALLAWFAPPGAGMPAAIAPWPVLAAAAWGWRRWWPVAAAGLLLPVAAGAAGLLPMATGGALAGTAWYGVTTLRRFRDH